MNIHPEFPESRLNHPSRQAELDVYLEVHATDMARPNRACREAEFPICAPGRRPHRHAGERWEVPHLTGHLVPDHPQQ